MARLALHALLAVCLVTAGCSVFAPDHTREARAVAALDDATNATAAAQTYRFESAITVTATTDGRTERFDTDLTGAVDTGAREMRTNATRDGQTRRSVLVNRTSYRECPPPWGGWAVEERDEETPWADHTPAVRQLSLLESGSLYWNGTRTLDGERVTVITGVPTEAALTEYQDDRRTRTFGGPSIEEPRLRAYLDTESGRLLRTALSFTVAGGDGTATATMSTTFSEYGDPVAVDVPEEAQTDPYELGCPGE